MPALARDEKGPFATSTFGFFFALSTDGTAVGAAATGSGKTLAYGLPLLHRLIERRAALGVDGSAARWRSLPGLVLVPTRELAMQVADHLSAVAAGAQCGVVVVPVVGGLAPEKQLRLLRSAG